MATITKCTCDLCQEPAKFLQQPVPVAFLTEQTEGRPCKPYLTTTAIDLCDGCLQRIVDSYPLTAYGAQGYNTYEWRKALRRADQQLKEP
jgi:hypothetical protein